MRNKLLFTAALFCVDVTPFGPVFTPANAAGVQVLKDGESPYENVQEVQNLSDLPVNAQGVVAGNHMYRVGTSQTFSGSIVGNAGDIEQAAGVDINTGEPINQSQPNNVTFTGLNAYNGRTIVRGNGSLTLKGEGNRPAAILSGCNQQNVGVPNCVKNPIRGGAMIVGFTGSDAATLTVDKNGFLRLVGEVDSNGKVEQPYGQLIVGNGDPHDGSSTTNQTSHMIVQNGGQVDVMTVSVGNYSAGKGDVSVIGDGSTMRVRAGGLTVGADGEGDLAIKQGGLTDVVGGNVTIGGSKDTSRGSVTVDGSGSTLHVENDTGLTVQTVVGDSGQGTLNVQNGGTVNTDGNVIIGNQAGGVGTVTVGNGQNAGANAQSRMDLTGSGSTGNLVVGNQGTGTLNVQQGGEVTAHSVSVGGQGSDSQLASRIASSDESAASQVSGQLNVSRGGQVNIGQGGLTVGRGVGSTPLYSVEVANGGVINNAGNTTIKSDGQLNVGSADQSAKGAGSSTLIVGDTNGSHGISGDAGQTNQNSPKENGSLVLYGNGIIRNRQGSDLHVDSNVALSDGTPSGEPVRHGTFDTNNQNTYLTGKLTGTGGVAATGGGTLYVANHDNSYQGETVVSGKNTTLALASGYGQASDSNNTSSSGIKVEDGAILTGNTTDNGAAAVTTVDGGGTVESNWNQSNGTLNIGAAGHQGTALTMNGSKDNQSVLSVGASTTPTASNSYITLNNVQGYNRGTGTLDTTGRSLTGSYRQLNSGLIHVNGDAQLNSATFNVVKTDSGRVYAGDGYRILTATGTVSANHDNALNSDLPTSLFVSPYLVFENQAVDVIYTRNAAAFSSVAGTRNEREVGHALDGMSDSNPVVQAMTGLTSAGEARRALGSLSGDIHASARTAMIQDSYLLEQAVLDRLGDASCDGNSDGDGILSSQGHYDLHTRRKGARCDSNHTIMWGQAYGSLGSNSGGNVSSLHHQTAGFVMGVDTPIDDRWRVGGMVAYGHSMFNTNGASNSSGNSNNISLGSYAGSHWGRFNLRLGAFYTWNLMNMRRHVQVADFGGRQTSNYRSGTGRAFTELSYKLNFGKVQFEPFLEGAYVNQYAGSFRERGVAALYGQSKDRSVGFTSFGFRVARSFQIGDMWLRAHAMGAYRRAYGSLGSSRTERFINDGSGMQVSGVLLSRDAAVVKAGLSAKVTNSVDLDLSYTGQYGEHSMDSGATGSVKVAF